MQSQTTAFFKISMVFYAMRKEGNQNQKGNIDTSSFSTILTNVVKTLDT